MMANKEFNMRVRNEYFENIKNVELLKAEQVNELEEDAYIYFGRVTCPYCREFVEEFPKVDLAIKYIDTENTDLNPELQKVREQFDVKTVPTFIHLKADGSFAKLNRDVRQSVADFVSVQA